MRCDNTCGYNCTRAIEPPNSVRFIVIILCCAAAVSCATVPAETPYNLGVAAYKKRNYAASEAWLRHTRGISARLNGTEDTILKDAKGSLDSLNDGLSARDLETGRALSVEYIARYGKPPP